ncbi:MAG: transposase [Candidatus Methanomethylophilaceae archaeon]|nr:transposase [Candidatus Methanomethylophilaceae archaeon]
MKVKRYIPEFKEAIVRKMMPPENVPIMRLAEESGVSYVTLAKWREEVRSGGEAAPGNGEQPERWSSEDKFLIVLETHALNEAELGEYYRSKGIFPAEIEEWREACLHANQREYRKHP